jgi:uncharacterized protein YciW
MHSPSRLLPQLLPGATVISNSYKGETHLEVTMAEIRFRRSDVEHLAEELFRTDLSYHQQVLLLAIFSAAAERVSQVWPEGAWDMSSERELADLRNQLVASFLHGDFDDKCIELCIRHTPPPPLPPH